MIAVYKNCRRVIEQTPTKRIAHEDVAFLYNMVSGVVAAAFMTLVFIHVFSPSAQTSAQPNHSPTYLTSSYK